MRAIFVVIAALAAVPPPARADTAGGLALFRAGAFAEAQIEWQSAAAAGDPRAALYLGVSYDLGQGVPADQAQAARWYRRAADGGNATAAFNLGVLHDAAATGAMRDPAEAARWYLRAAELGSARAEYNLGLLYEDGANGVPPDLPGATRFFQAAASHGVAAAREHLARLRVPYRRQAVARPPPDDGLLGFRQAQLALLSRGPGDASRAAALFRQAADQNPLAAYDLAYCYENGLGVPRDRVAAYRWYRRAGAAARDQRLRDLAQGGAETLRSKLDRTELGQLTDRDAIDLAPGLR